MGMDNDPTLQQMPWKDADNCVEHHRENQRAEGRNLSSSTKSTEPDLKHMSLN